MKLGKICISLSGTDAAAVYRQIESALDDVDAVEVRLDGMDEPETAKCCSLLRKPLLFVNRPVWEGGAFAGDEDERIKPLVEAARLRAAYVDLELRADLRLRRQLLNAIQDGPTKLILSWHDFRGTPSAGELACILGQMQEGGAHIGKIVTTAHGPNDVLRTMSMLELARAANFPLSCFCMGDAGRISRLATLYLGGFMTYACISDAQSTAPGQLSIGRLRQLTSLLA